MEIKDILTLIDAVSASNLTSFCYEEGETKLSFEKAEKQTVKISNMNSEEMVAARAAEESFVSCDQNLCTITSPMVGTFYMSGSEGGEPFVSVGDHIKAGQVVGIVEAMKLMNEIESPYDGVVEQILIKNKEMVGFGDDIIKIRPAR
ncbi:MAG: acetyl-CoA carboxylase biotin carboxyl carrier protein [Lachnospiraceae bacterium]|nr:acetyl-CoA carboxylase biotin carboxyl carrier protein [Lachnospiraceae bacterium]